MVASSQTTLKKAHYIAMVGLVASLYLASGLIQAASPQNEKMAIARWDKLREVERYQLNIAEKLYAQDNFKAAADEYEKYLKLYDRSEAASFAQFRWSHCQVRLKKLNTAIKDGYQTVLDYFPDSPEAPLSAFLIGDTQQSMGDLREAKKSFAKVLDKYKQHNVAVLARQALADIAGKESDASRRLALLRELAFDIKREGLNDVAERACKIASSELARLQFNEGNFEEGLKALAQNYKEEVLPTYLIDANHGALLTIVSQLYAGKDPEKQKAVMLADQGISYLQNQAVNLLNDEKTRPTAKGYLFHAADLHGRVGRFAQQREVYENLLKTLGNDDTVLAQLAAWLKGQNKRDEARQVYLRYSDKIQGQNQIAYSWREERQFDKAIGIYQRLSLDDSKNAAAWLSEAAITYRQAGKPDQAIAIYRDLMQKYVDKVAVYHWEIAETQRSFGKWKDALTSYKTYPGTDKAPTIYYEMAACNRALKQFDEAYSLYGQIISAHPESAPEAMHRLAATYEEAGNIEKAKDFYKMVCGRFPRSAQASAAHRHLNDKYKITLTLGGAKDD